MDLAYNEYYHKSSTCYPNYTNDNDTDHACNPTSDPDCTCNPNYARDHNCQIRLMKIHYETEIEKMWMLIFWTSWDRDKPVWFFYVWDET